jgi:neutral ceramidase
MGRPSSDRAHHRRCCAKAIADVKSGWTVVVLAAGWLLGSAGCGALHSAGEEGLRVGVAEVDITPPVGHRMAGYFDERLATGVHDSLFARAMVLEQGRERVALVFCDLLGVPLKMSSKARQRASHATGIPFANIMVCATHSHTGPLFSDVRRDFFHERAVAKFGHDPHEEVFYPKLLEDKIVEVIVTAVSRSGAAELSAGFGQLEGVAFNRRYHMSDGSVRFNPGVLNPDIVRAAGPVDPAVGVMLVRRGGKEAAAVTVFACHCDTTGGTEYSADYPYYLSEALRRQFGSEFVSMFGAGACGDLNHINVGARDSSKGTLMPERIGTNLAAVVLQASAGLRPVERPRLRASSRVLELPLQEVSPEQVEAARQRLPTLVDRGVPLMEKVEAVKRLDLANMGKSWPMEVQVFRFDHQAAMVCLPGEIFVELGLEIKKRSPFATTLVVSICNDRPAYVPTLKAFSEGSYEVTNSRIEPGGGERLVEAAVEMLKELKQVR